MTTSGSNTHDQGSFKTGLIDVMTRALELLTLGEVKISGGKPGKDKPLNSRSAASHLGLILERLLAKSTNGTPPPQVTIKQMEFRDRLKQVFNDSIATDNKLHESVREEESWRNAIEGRERNLQQQGINNRTPTGINKALALAHAEKAISAELPLIFLSDYSNKSNGDDEITINVTLQRASPIQQRRNRVVVLTRQWQGTWMPPVLRGMQSAAEKAGWDLQHLTPDDDSPETAKAAFEAALNHPLKPNAAILSAVKQDDLDCLTWLMEQPNLRVVSSGGNCPYERQGIRKVRQADREIGGLVKSAVEKLRAHNGAEVVLLHPAYTAEEHDPIGRRLRPLQDVHSMKKVQWNVTPAMRLSVNSSKAAIPRQIAPLLKACSKEDSKRVVFIALTSDIALRLLMELREFNAFCPRERFRIVSVDFVDVLLLELADPSSPLEVIVGPDMYSYGREVMNAVIGDDVVNKQVLPILVTKQDAIKKPVKSILQLTSYYEEQSDKNFPKPNLEELEWMSETNDTPSKARSKSATMKKKKSSKVVKRR